MPGLGSASKAAVATAASNVVSIVAISAAAESEERLAVAVAAVVVIGVNWWLHKQLVELRQQAPAAVMQVAGVFLVAGIAAGAAWLWADAPDLVGFAGLFAALFGGGQLLVALRYLETTSPWGGLILAGACAAAFFVGLVIVTVNGPGRALLLVGAGVFFTPVAMGMMSEHVLPARRGAPPHQPPDRLPSDRTMWLFAGIPLVAALVLLPLVGVPFRFTFGVALVVVLIVFAITTDTLLDVVGAVVIVALVWSGAPRTEALPDVADPQDGDEVIVAIGDSFISGEGAEAFIDGTNVRGENECRRAPTAYPVVAVRRNRTAGVPDKVHFGACSGAKARHVADTPQYTGDPVGNGGEGLSQIAAWKARADEDGLVAKAVVLSIGGNDALFGEIGQACVAPGKCPELGGLWLDNLRKLGESLEPAYRAVDESFGDVPVVVVPYPIPLSARKCSYSALSNSEHRFLHDFTMELNAVIRAKAAEHRFHVLDEVETVLEEHELRLCDTGDPDDAGVNFLAAHPVEGLVADQVNPRNWLHNSLHPNRRGHSELADELSEWLDDLGGHPARTTASASADDPHEVRTIESIMGDERFAHCGNVETAPRSCRSKTSYWVTAQVMRSVWFAVPIFLVLLTGAWALSLQVIRWWRTRPGA